MKKSLVVIIGILLLFSEYSIAGYIDPQANCTQNWNKQTNRYDCSGDCHQCSIDCCPGK